MKQEAVRSQHELLAALEQLAGVPFTRMRTLFIPGSTNLPANIR